MFNNFVSKIVPFMKYVQKYYRAGQVADVNMTHVFFYEGYVRILTYSQSTYHCFSTTTKFSQTGLNATYII